MTEMQRDDDDALPAELRDAVAQLRAAPDPRAEWRARVVDAAVRAPVLHLTAPQRTRSVAWIAIAASLVGAVIGGGGVYLATSRPQATTLAASEPVVAARHVSVRFTFVAPRASTVAIVGDFNRWDPGAVPLARSADGTVWEVDVPLVPGRYAYAFMVDGKLARDPSAPQVKDDDFGSPNSIVMVKGS